MTEPHNAESAAGVVYDMIRERDHYRAISGEAVRRIEAESSKQIDASGAIVGRLLPIELWREIRAMLQSEPRPTTPEEG